MTALHNFSGPLYEQVHDLICGKIRSGEWRAGTPLPGEMHLSRELGVSVGTVRKAMDKLALARMIVRERGRGTFISEQPTAGPSAGLEFRSPDGQRIPVEISVAGFFARIATPEERRLFKIRHVPGVMPRVIDVRRAWRNGSALLCRETLTVHRARMPRVALGFPEGAEVSFLHYARSFGVVVTRTEWSLGAVADQASSSDRGAEPSSRSIALRRIAYDAKDTVVEICKQELTLTGETYHLDPIALTQP